MCAWLVVSLFLLALWQTGVLSHLSPYGSWDRLNTPHTTTTPTNPPELDEQKKMNGFGRFAEYNFRVSASALQK